MTCFIQVFMINGVKLTQNKQANQARFWVDFQPYGRRIPVPQQPGPRLSFLGLGYISITVYRPKSDERGLMAASRKLLRQQSEYSLCLSHFASQFPELQLEHVYASSSDCFTWPMLQSAVCFVSQQSGYRGRLAVWR